MSGNIQNIPASVIASWPKPNYDAKGRTWIVPFTGVLQAITTIMVGTRLYLRYRRQAGCLGFDDLLLVPAFLAATMFTVLLMVSTVGYGTNRHVWNVPSTLFADTALIAWLAEHAFLVSTCCTKISILLFYRGLTEGTISRRWRLATIGAIWFTAGYCVALILSLFLSCTPLEAYWKAHSLTYNKEYSCADTTIMNPLSGALSVLSDTYAVVMPMSMLRHLDCPRRQKIALNFVFSLGFVVVIAGCVRTYYLSRLGVDYDSTWLGYDLYLWSDLEIQLALICACAPALRVFFRRYLTDPVSRIMNSARSPLGSRNTQRDSKLSGHGNAEMRGPSGRSLESGEKKLLQHHAQRPLQSVSEEDMVESAAPSIAPTLDTYIVKTPADFESYALQNLERNRPPPRPTYPRKPSEPEPEDDLQHSFNSPFTDWQSPRNSLIV